MIAAAAPYTATLSTLFGAGVLLALWAWDRRPRRRAILVDDGAPAFAWRAVMDLPIGGTTSLAPRAAAMIRSDLGDLAPDTVIADDAIILSITVQASSAAHAHRIARRRLTSLGMFADSIVVYPHPDEVIA